MSAGSVPVRPGSRRARRGPRHGRRSRGSRAWGWAALILGGLTLAASALLLGAPVWSALWNARAQRAAAAAFAATLSRGAGETLATLRSPQAQAAAPSPPAPPPVWPFLQPRVTVAASGPMPPTAPGAVLARLVIPAIGVDSYVLQGLTWQGLGGAALLRRGPAHLQGSALPGQQGDVVILGHLNVWGSVFLHLRRLGPGDAVYLQAGGQTFEYRVTGQHVVAATDVSALAPRAGGATLQLATCAGLWDGQRRIVDAALVPAPRPAAAGGLAAAESLVLRYERDAAAGELSAAYALLSPPWRAETSPAGLAAAGGILHATILDGWSLGGGEAEVVVRQQLLQAGRTRVVAYVADAASLLSAHVVRPSPPLLLPPPALDRPTEGASGQLLCGGYRVAWQVGAQGHGASAGFSFLERPSLVRVASPAGVVLSGLQVPGLALGTYPVGCGDLAGDGSEELILASRLDRAGDASISIYRLGTAVATLIGQSSAVPGARVEIRPGTDGGPAAIAVGGQPTLRFAGGAFHSAPQAA